MKIKCFTASNMQLALKQIREELGPDAVILSSRKVAEGTEVVGALNYDEETERKRLPGHSAEFASSAEIARETVARQASLEQEKANIRRKLEETRRRLHQTHDLTEKPERVTQLNVPRSDEFSESAAKLSETNQNISDMCREITELRTILQQQTASSWNERQDFSTLLRSVNLQSAAEESSRITKGSARLAAFPSEFQQKLIDLGILPEVQEQLLQQLEPGQDMASLWRNLLANMAHGISTVDDELIDKPGCIALVGPTGVGKTTTIAKLAARFVLKNGPQNIALVTTDRFRVAASQQLQSFGRLLDVPVIIVNEQQTLDDVLDHLSGKQLVLVDTAGLNPQDINWKLQCQDLLVERHRLTNYLVVSAVTQPQVMQSNYHHYKMLNISGCIVTKLDEAFTLGEVLSMTILNQLPVAYFTDGQQIPQHLHHAKAHALVVRAVALAQKASTEKSINSALSA